MANFHKKLLKKHMTTLKFCLLPLMPLVVDDVTTQHWMLPHHPQHTMFGLMLAQRHRHWANIKPAFVSKFCVFCASLMMNMTCTQG